MVSYVLIQQQMLIYILSVQTPGGNLIEVRHDRERWKNQKKVKETRAISMTW